MTSPESKQTSIEDSSITEPNGLPKWENDLLGLSEQERKQPSVIFTSDDAENLRAYRHDLMQNGNSAFDNDLLDIPDTDRYKPANKG